MIERIIKSVIPAGAAGDADDGRARRQRRHYGAHYLAPT